MSTFRVHMRYLVQFLNNSPLSENSCNKSVYFWKYKFISWQILTATFRFVEKAWIALKNEVIFHKV